MAININSISVSQAKDEIDKLVNQTNTTHQPILLVSKIGNAVLISGKD